MTNQQLIAIQNPCFKAEQTCNQRYRRLLKSGRFIISTLLTLNVGEE